MGGRPTTAQERRYIDLTNGPTSEQYQRGTLGVTLVTVETKLWRGGFIEICQAFSNCGNLQSARYRSV